MLQILWKRFREYLPLLLLGTAILCTGLVAGAVIEKYAVSYNSPDLAPLSLPGTPELPLIFFDKIENGVLFGRNEGSSARFIVGKGKEEEIFSINSGPFSFPVISLLPNLRSIPAPPGMRYVSSKQGTKFWPLDAPEAALITVKNRIFFPDEAAALARGLKRGK